MYKKIMMAGLMACGLIPAHSQEKTNSILPYTRPEQSLAVSVYGGVSSPLGKYGGSVGQAQQGITGSVDVDYLFAMSKKLGLTIGVLYQQHNRDQIVDNGRYSFPIKDGYTTFTQDDRLYYSQFGLFIGPMLKFYNSSRLEASIYVRAGIIHQHNPDFYQTIYGYNAYKGDYVPVEMPYFAYNFDVPSVTMMTNAGLKLNYKINNHWAAGVKVDYLVIPEESGNVGAMTTEVDWDGLKNSGITFYSRKSNDHNFSEYSPNGFYVSSFAKITSLNFNIGLQYQF